MSAPKADPAVASPKVDQPEPNSETADAEVAFTLAKTQGAKNAATDAWLAAAEKENATQTAPADSNSKKKRRVHRRLGPRCANPDCDHRIPPVVQERYRGDLCPPCAKKRLTETKNSPEAKTWFRGWAAREYSGASQVAEPKTVKLANGRVVNAKHGSGGPPEPSDQSEVIGVLKQDGVGLGVVSGREAGLVRGRKKR